MNITSEDIKHLLDTNDDIYDEIHKYYKESEKKREIKHLLDKIRQNLCENIDENIIDKYFSLINGFEIINSNFNFDGCSHQIKFNIGTMQVLYTFYNLDAGHQRPPESKNVYIDKKRLIKMSREDYLKFSEIQSFYNGDYDTIDDYDYRKESFNYALCHEGIKEFNTISKHHFPDEKPHVIFNLICAILCYYHD